MVEDVNNAMADPFRVVALNFNLYSDKTQENLQNSNILNPWERDSIMVEGTESHLYAAAT